MFLLPNIFKLLYNYVNIYEINTENYNKTIDEVMKGLDCKSNNYKVFVKWYVSNLQFYEAKNMDNSFIYLYKKYIDLENCKNFDDFELNEFRNKYQAVLKLPHQSVIPDFTFENTKKEPIKIAETYPKADFTFIIFFSPSCNHCEENIPKNKLTLETLRSKYPNKILQFVSVLNDTDETKWETFLPKVGIENWLNLKTVNHNMAYQEMYSTYTNPNYIMLNRKGEVILKSYNIKAIEDLIKGN